MKKLITLCLLTFLSASAAAETGLIQEDYSGEIYPGETVQPKFYVLSNENITTEIEIESGELDITIDETNFEGLEHRTQTIGSSSGNTEALIIEPRITAPLNYSGQETVRFDIFQHSMESSKGQLDLVHQYTADYKYKLTGSPQINNQTNRDNNIENNISQTRDSVSEEVEDHVSSLTYVAAILWILTIFYILKSRF